MVLIGMAALDEAAVEALADGPARRVGYRTLAVAARKATSRSSWIGLIPMHKPVARRLPCGSSTRCTPTA